MVVVSVASADDGTFAPKVLGRLTGEHRSRLKGLWADGKYRNHSLDAWLLKAKVAYAIDVVGRLAGSDGLVEQPQRYAVERTFAWLGRYRRQSRDHERFEGSSEAMIKISSIHRMLRLLRKDKSIKAVLFKYREIPQKVTG